MAVITRTFPPPSARPGDEPVGCGRRRRHARRTDPRRRAGRRARLAVDLLRQRAGRRRRVRARRPAGARSCRRHVRRFDLPASCAQRRRHVPAGVRHPGGSELRLGHDRGPGLGVVADHRAASWCWRCSSPGRPARRRSRCSRCALFRDRNFSLANVAITARRVRRSPRWRSRSTLYAQGVLGLSPDRRGAARSPRWRSISGGPRAVRRAADRPRPPALGRRVRARVLRRRSGLAGRGHGRRPRRSGQLLLPIALIGVGQRVHVGARSPPRPPATCR